MRYGVVLGVVIAGVMGCTDLLAPMPGHPTLIQPRAEWRAWYAIAEKCSGRTGNFDRVRWYTYPGELVPHRNAAAITTEHDHKIAIAEYWVTTPDVITHEALHDILGVAGHPAEYFGHAPLYADGKCSAFVRSPALPYDAH